MATLIHQPADKLFKLSLEKQQVAQDFLQTHLPPLLLENIDLNTLVVEKESFLDEAYKTNAADVVYRVQLQAQTAYIYVLCEQQSKVDPKMAFRLLVYTVRLMEAHLRKHPESPLPLVYPLVVYSGDKPWDAALEIYPLFGEQEALARDWLLKPYQLFDIQRTPDETLKNHALCGIMEFALKHQKARDLAALLEILFPWMYDLEIHNPEPGVFLGKAVLKYLANGIEAEDIEVFTKKAEHFLNQQLKGEAMTLAQKFEERGMIKGMQEGIQQGMRQGEAMLLAQLIQCRFGKLPAMYADRIKLADSQTLLQWGKRVLEAETLEEIFNN